MSSRIIFRFKSMREPDSIEFNGNSIALGDLVNRIVEKRRLSRQQADFDLVVTNDLTKEVYRGDDTKIPKGSRLIVNRVPASYGVLARMRGGGAGPGGAAAGQPGASNGGGNPSAEGDESFGGSVFDAPYEDKPEEKRGMMQKLAEIAEQNSQQNRQKRQATRQSGFNAPGQAAGRGAGMVGGRGLPSNLNQKQMDRRANIGVPKIFLTSANPEPGSENKSSGKPGGGWLQFGSDSTKFHQQVKERGGVTKKLDEEEVRKRIDPADIPEEFLCALTNKLLKDCVTLPCCDRNVSSEEIDQALVNSSFVCPLCKSEGIQLDKLRPNKEIRRKVQDLILEQKEKLEKNSAAEAERAAASAEKERQERLTEKKAFKRPDAVVDLSTGNILTEADIDRKTTQNDNADPNSSSSSPPPGASEIPSAEGKEEPSKEMDANSQAEQPSSSSAFSKYLVSSDEHRGRSDGTFNRGSPHEYHRDDRGYNNNNYYSRGRGDYRGDDNRFRQRWDGPPPPPHGHDSQYGGDDYDESRPPPRYHRDDYRSPRNDDYYNHDDRHFHPDRRNRNDFLDRRRGGGGGRDYYRGPRGRYDDRFFEGNRHDDEYRGRSQSPARNYGRERSPGREVDEPRVSLEQQSHGDDTRSAGNLDEPPHRRQSDEFSQSERSTGGNSYQRRNDRGPRRGGGGGGRRFGGNNRQNGRGGGRYRNQNRGGQR